MTSSQRVRLSRPRRDDRDAAELEADAASTIVAAPERMTAELEAETGRALAAGRHDTLRPAAILHLQRAAGNARVTRMLQEDCQTESRASPATRADAREAGRSASGAGSLIATGATDRQGQRRTPGARPTLALQRAAPASRRRAGGRGTPGGPAGKAKRTVPWDEALQVLDAITDILANPGEVFIEEEGRGYLTSSLALHKDVPERWQSLLSEWWLIATGKVRDASGVVVSYYGDDLGVHIDLAGARTEPLTRTLLAEGDETTGPWLAKNYTSRVKALRARAASEAVTAAIEKAAKKGVGGKLDVSTMTELGKAQAGSAEALRTIRAVMTAAQRIGSANAADAKKLDKLFREAIGSEDLPPSLATVKAMNLQAALLHLQGGLNLAQAIANVADPERRTKIYLEHADRFGPAAGTMEILKNLGWFVSGATTIAGASTFAIAKVLGKADLAAKALTIGSKALGNINFAVNAFGVIHGIAILVNERATTEEKAEAVMEVGTSGLGVAARFVPVLAAPAAAATASVVINFYFFKELLTEAMQGYAGLVALGLNVCYRSMQTAAKDVSRQAMGYAAALDLAGVITEPAKAAALKTQTEALRWNLEVMIKEFMGRATLTRGGRNEDPGTYELLRRRFEPLKGAKLETDAQIIAFTARLLETIARCSADAKEIYKEQVEYGWSHR